MSVKNICYIIQGEDIKNQYYNIKKLKNDYSFFDILLIIVDPLNVFNECDMIGSDLIIGNIGQCDVPLGEGFKESYLVSQKIIEYIENNKVDLNVIHFDCDDNMIAYYTLQEKFFGNTSVCNSSIVISSNDIDTYNDDFKFPYYWHKISMYRIVELSDFIVTKSLNTYNSILQLPAKKDRVLYNCSFKELMDVYTCLVKEPKINWIKDIRYRHNFDTVNMLEINSTKELLSVIIPYYNLGKYIIDTIRSVTNCSYKNIEIIIVNDGSNDTDSIKILESIKEEFDVRIINTKNNGLSSARNIGAKEANGEYITFLDADDMVKIEYYSKCINILKKYENISFVYSWVQFFEGKDEIWPTFNIEPEILLLSNMLAAFAVIRKKDFVNYGLNDEKMKSGMEDYDGWISMVRNGCIGISIPEPLVLYRYRLNSMSKSFNRKNVIKLYEYIFSKHEDLYKFYSFDLMRIITENGPGYLWNNPTFSYPQLGYLSSDNEKIENTKYELIRMANSKWGKFIVNILFKLKLNKLFK